MPATTFGVTTTADNGGVNPTPFAGTGTFRQAIIDANETAGADVVTFNIPGTGPHTIQPLAALPTVTDTVTIDGTTQPGFVGTPVVVLTGIAAGAGVSGLTITAANSTIRGLVVNGFDSHGAGRGILVTGPTATGTVIAGNYIGTTADGMAALGNYHGIFVSGGATGTVVGGTTAADRNVISGSIAAGVALLSGKNTVLGNYVGTNAAGTAAVPNLVGIGPGDLADGTIIGGTVPGSGNLISGNWRGIWVESGTTILGNLIGTNSTGTAALGNTLNGIRVSPQASSTLIGGTTPAERNIISGNLGDGIDDNGVGTKITGNYIGVDITGLVGLGNKGSGVSGYGIIGGLTTVPGTGAGNVISGNAYGIRGANSTIQGNIVGLGADGATRLGNIGGILSGSNNLIGGTADGARNVIGNSVQFDIAIGEPTVSNSNNNTVQGNYIGTDITGTISVQNPGNANGLDNNGIFISGSNNLIGGSAPRAGNLISGHSTGSGSTTIPPALSARTTT